MSGLVVTQTHGSVCHIAMNDGPDNLLSQAMCLELSHELKTAFETDDVRAVLLTGQNDVFSVGYGLGELSVEASQNSLFQLIDMLVAAPKPVIAGLQGSAFGAGFEIALLCAFRLAAPGVKVGLPDVLHGLPPCAGASQTLPRILGAEQAIELILSGETLPASELDGVIDAEIKGDFLSGAMRFAQTLAAQELGDVSIAARSEGLSDPSSYQEALVDARRAEANSDQVAADVIDAVETALLLPFSAGVVAEREVFKSAEVRPEARAKRHLLHEEKRLKHGITTEIQSTTRPGLIAVVGEGTLSQVSAARLLLAGASVNLVHSDGVQSEKLRSDILEAARHDHENDGDGAIQETQLSERLSLTSNLSDCSTADLVLDASEDNLATLEQRAQTLSTLLPEHVFWVVASQYLGFASVERAFARPNQIAKLWLEPDLLQDFCAFSLPPDILVPNRTIVLSLTDMLGVSGIETKAEAGAVVISLWVKLMQAAETLCLAGTPISAIDTALADRGFADGPFHMADALGLDLVTQLNSELGEAEGRLDLSQMLADNDHVGTASGAGFYLYEGEQVGRPNPEATKLIQSIRDGRGQKVSALEVQHYCLAVLANEAAQMLEQGVVNSPGALDLLLTDALGLSSDLGGPLHAADSEGLLHLRYLLTNKDGRETPSKALLDLIKNGLSFGALDAEASSPN